MQIYYFTRTGRSETIAQALSEEYNTPCYQILDNINHKGTIDFLKCGASASKKESKKGVYPKPKEKDIILLIFPIWAGSLPPVIREFVNSNQTNEIIAITTSLGTGLKEDKFFVNAINLIGKNIVISEDIHKSIRLINKKKDDRVNHSLQ